MSWDVQVRCYTTAECFDNYRGSKYVFVGWINLLSLKSSMSKLQGRSGLDICGHLKTLTDFTAGSLVFLLPQKGSSYQ